MFKNRDTLLIEQCAPIKILTPSYSAAADYFVTSRAAS